MSLNTARSNFCR